MLMPLAILIKKKGCLIFGEIYLIKNHNCKDFVAEAVKILKLNYNENLIEILYNSKVEGKDEEEIVPYVILNKLKRFYVKMDI